ncbi:MAG TPA: phytoene/squalene synthase family protein [Bryobacteraceae bacterium]|nr:phytoene/squalene synthase family protein [Bryobacteraceae bacterium]
MTVAGSYAYCRRVARSQARNFYYSFVLLSKPQRDAMCAIYSFMRHSDDLSDDPAVASSVRMEHWRAELDAALQGKYGENPCWPAFHDAVLRYNIPHEYFYQMIEGVSSDLRPRNFQTFDELYRYCYQVASVVGLTIVHIFGFNNPMALPLAEKCGIAFQLTNIIRDVKEDSERGRDYLPLEDRELLPDIRDLLRYEGERAKSYFRESLPLLGMVSSRSRASLWALIEIYRQLLERIEAKNYDVFSDRIRLSAFEKLAIVVKAWMFM